MAKKKANNLSLLPPDADLDIVRIERNLAVIGFWAVGETPKGKGRKDTKPRRYEFTVVRDGVRVQVASEFRPSELGHPGIADKDKYHAFMKILMEERAKNGGQIPTPVCFTGSRMIRELGLARTGKVYDEIREWGKRMTDTSFTSERSVYFASKKAFTDDTLHVFNRFRSYGISSEDGEERSEGFEVYLSDWFIENLRHKYVVTENYAQYRMLTRPISKCIFDFLHIWFQASNGKKVERDYIELCTLLSIRSFPHLSRIKQAIGPALDELKAIDYIETWDIQPRLTKDAYKIVLTAGKEILRVISVTNQRPTLSTVSTENTEAEKAAIDLMIARGIAPKKAAQIAKDYNPDIIIDQVEYASSLIERERGSKIENPPGFIIYHIENALPVPDDFMTSRRKQEIELRERQKQDLQEQEQRLYADYLEWKKQEIEREIVNRFPGAVLDQKLKDISEIKVKDRDAYFIRTIPSKRPALARQFLDKEIAEELSLVSFEEWCEERVQMRMF